MKKLLLLLPLLALPLFFRAQSTVNADLTIAPSDQLDKAIPELMTLADIPGLSIAIVKDDRLVYQRAFGLRSADTREPVTDRTIFAAASLSKALFAYGLMKWVEKGKFDLDRPLHEYYTYQDLAHDDRYRQLTARHVLSHTTGLPNWRRGEQLNFVRDPGRQFGYSGEGFVILMRVIEHLSGQSIEDFMKQRVFDPLGMDRSSYIWQDAFETDHAIPHDRYGHTAGLRKPQEGNTAYSLQTTAVDYSKFLRAMLSAKGLKVPAIEQMLRGQIEVEGKSVQWGLGVGLQSTEAGLAFWHWGDNGPFKAFCIAFPRQQVGLVYFANSSNGLGIADDLLRTCLGGSYPALAWIDYEGPKAPARQLLRHILETDGKHSDPWPYLAEHGLHQDTQQIAERPMNRLGYELLSLGKLDAAERIFAMNTRAYPQSANVFDSYGEALLRNGKREAAATAYAEAYRLDPDNETAKTAVHQLKMGNRTGNTTFQLEGYPYARSVQLTGSFNNWNEISHPMVRENGRWIGRVDLKPGTYRYKFIVDGVWILDPANPKTEYSDHHNSILVKE